MERTPCRFPNTALNAKNVSANSLRPSDRDSNNSSTTAPPNPPPTSRPPSEPTNRPRAISPATPAPTSWKPPWRTTKDGYAGASVTCPHCQQAGPFHAHRPKTFVGLLGPLTVPRASSYRGRCGHGSCPFDTQAALSGRHLTLAAEEIVEGVRIPRLSAEARWGYHKLTRKTGEFAHAIGAVVIDKDTCSIVAGATASRPLVLELPAADILSRPPASDDIRGMLEQAGLQGDAYQMSIHTVAVRRALAEALARA